MQKKISENKVEEFTKTSVNLFGGSNVQITSICSNSILNEVINMFGTNISIEKIGSEKFKLVLDADVNGFYFWALSNLGDVEVIKPIELRNRIKDVLKRSREKYMD